jgi:hypothetical protein
METLYPLLLERRLEFKKHQCKDYLAEEDWHGVRDTVSEIETILAEMRGFNRQKERGA